MTCTFTQQKGGTKDNATLVLGKDGKTLNAVCYNCRNLGYNCPGAGCTGTCSLQVVHNFAQNQIQQNEPINDNWVILETCSFESVLKFIFGGECQKLPIRGEIIDFDERRASIFQSDGGPSTIAN